MNLVHEHVMLIDPMQLPCYGPQNRLLASATLAVALAVAGVARADTVAYSAPQDATSLYSNNQIGFAPCCGLHPAGISGAFGVGNTVAFAGSGPFHLTTVDLFGYAGGGSLPIEVALYSGSNPNTGTLLASNEVTPTGNGWTTEALNFQGLLVPQTITYIVSIGGNNGSYDNSFVNWQQFTGASAPTVGTSGDMWYGSRAAFVLDDSYAIDTGALTNTLAVRFSVSQFGGSPAIPETPIWAMLGLGFAALGFAGYRRARTPRALAV